LATEEDDMLEKKRREEKDFGNLGISHFKLDALFFFFFWFWSFVFNESASICQLSFATRYTVCHINIFLTEYDGRD
jgi:hypothetical protein